MHLGPARMKKTLHLGFDWGDFCLEKTLAPLSLVVVLQ